MAALKYLILFIAIILLCSFFLHKRAKLSGVFCCAFCVAACVCVVAVFASWRWIAEANRYTVRMEALTGVDAGDKGAKEVWLRNVFSVNGKRSSPTFPRVMSGMWEQADDGLYWHAQHEAMEQTDEVLLSLPVAARYTLFFKGNDQGGKIRLVDPKTEKSRVIDTYRDGAEWIDVFAEVDLGAATALWRVRILQALAFLGCGMVSAGLFAALCAVFRRGFPVLRHVCQVAWNRLAQRLESSRFFHAPLDPNRWRWYPIALFVLLLLPLAVIAIYAHPTYNDYTFGRVTKEIWQQGGSILQVLRGAVDETRVTYTAWQGSFAAVFLMTLQPSVFGERMYIVTPFFLMGSLSVAIWLFTRTTIGKSESKMLGWLAMLFSIQFLPRADESIFWYNGGIYYTFFFALSLVLCSLLLLSHRAKNPMIRMVYAASACLLAAFVGAGNYVTALATSVLITLLVLGQCIRRDRRWWIPFASLLCLLATLSISIISPGNAVRQSVSSTPPMPYLAAIVAALSHALRYLWISLRIEYVLGILIALPFFLQAAERSNYSFRHPALMSVLSFGVFASQFVPHLAALSVDGPPRIMSIIFFSYLLLLGYNCFYWCGWFVRKKGIQSAPTLLSRWVAAVASVLLVISCAITVVREPDAINGASAAISFATGDAQRYASVYDEWVRILEDESVRDAHLPPILRHPYVIRYAEMSQDSSDWLNVVAAQYYGKDSVTVDWEKEITR